MLATLPDSLMTKDPRKNKSEIKEWITSTIPWDKKWDGLGENVSDDSNDDEK